MMRRTYCSRYECFDVPGADAVIEKGGARPSMQRSENSKINDIHLFALAVGQEWLLVDRKRLEELGIVLLTPTEEFKFTSIRLTCTFPVIMRICSEMPRVEIFSE